MKLRSIITTILITIFAFGTVLITSCTKNKCTNTTCQNGGSCSNGFCTCPYGYSGDFCEIRATSYINYINNSFTPITITLNTGVHGAGYAYTIPAGMSKGFTGSFGDTLQGNAFTRGPYGEQVNWDTVMNIYPINGTVNVNLNVPPSYYYVFLFNDSASSFIREVNVNRGLPTEIDILFPAPYLAYQSIIGLGYFTASTTSNIYAKSSTNWGFTFPAPFWTALTQNQYVQVNCQ